MMWLNPEPGMMVRFVGACPAPDDNVAQKFNRSVAIFTTHGLALEFETVVNVKATKDDYFEDEVIPCSLLRK